MSKLKIKNGNTWEEIPAGGVGVPSGGTQKQVLVKTGSADYATGWDDVENVLPQWTLAGTSASTSAVVTYPATAKELFIKGLITGGKMFSCIVPVALIQDVTIIMVGGYAAGTTDIGIANVNHDAANRTLAFRNLSFGSSADSGPFYFYYR